MAGSKCFIASGSVVGHKTWGQPLISRKLSAVHDSSGRRLCNLPQWETSRYVMFTQTSTPVRSSNLPQNEVSKCCKVVHVPRGERSTNLIQNERFKCSREVRGGKTETCEQCDRSRNLRLEHLASGERSESCVHQDKFAYWRCWIEANFCSRRQQERSRWVNILQISRGEASVTQLLWERLSNSNETQPVSAVRSFCLILPVNTRLFRVLPHSPGKDSATSGVSPLESDPDRLTWRWLSLWHAVILASTSFPLRCTAANVRDVRLLLRSLWPASMASSIVNSIKFSCSVMSLKRRPRLIRPSSCIRICDRGGDPSWSTYETPGGVFSTKRVMQQSWILHIQRLVNLTLPRSSFVSKKESKCSSAIFGTEDKETSAQQAKRDPLKVIIIIMRWRREWVTIRELIFYHWYRQG